MFWYSLGHAMIIASITFHNRLAERLVHPYTYFMIPLGASFFQVGVIQRGQQPGDKGLAHDRIAESRKRLYMRIRCCTFLPFSSAQRLWVNKKLRFGIKRALAIWLFSGLSNCPIRSLKGVSCYDYYGTFAYSMYNKIFGAVRRYRGERNRHESASDTDGSNNETLLYSVKLAE